MPSATEHDHVERLEAHGEHAGVAGGQDQPGERREPAARPPKTRIPLRQSPVATMPTPTAQTASTTR